MLRYVTLRCVVSIVFIYGMRTLFSNMIMTLYIETCSKGTADLTNIALYTVSPMYSYVHRAYYSCRWRQKHMDHK